MATLSSILAWEIPQTEEPGGLQSRGSQRVRHYTEATMHAQQLLVLFEWDPTHLIRYFYELSHCLKAIKRKPATKHTKDL